MHAERCPVCLGEGTLQKNSLYENKENTITCHGCGGRGWVEVRDEPVFIPNVDAIKFGEK